MLEFDRSDGNEGPDGRCWPAGGHWLDHQRLDRVAGISWIDVATAEPADLAAHWSRVIGLTSVGDGFTLCGVDVVPRTT